MKERFGRGAVSQDERPDHRVVVHRYMQQHGFRIRVTARGLRCKLGRRGFLPFFPQTTAAVDRPMQPLGQIRPASGTDGAARHRIARHGRPHRVRAARSRRPNDCVGHLRPSGRRWPRSSAFVARLSSTAHGCPRPSTGGLAVRAGRGAAKFAAPATYDVKDTGRHTAGPGRARPGSPGRAAFAARGGHAMMGRPGGRGTVPNGTGSVNVPMVSYTHPHRSTP